MSAERWQQVKAIFHEALKKNPAERAGFLEQACAGDPTLRLEVDTLIQHHEDLGDFLESPAAEVLVQAATATETRNSLVGRTLGDYSVKALIGSGGMGDVYRAHDSRLKRDVAMKVLPELFARDPERIWRFQREAEVLASLNHPNIAAIYDLARFGNIRLLILELVDGETLAQRISRGGIPVEETRRIARQIADALEAAHAHGVVHRDLKPANIKITPNGAVKVLDFGLAKVREPDPAISNISNSPTLVTAKSDGVILGTAPYMSPEQARGLTVDKKTDVWAFGCVLYEMLTGRKAFDGRTATDAISAVLQKSPDWKALSGDVPSSMRRLLQRCIEKDSRLRLHDIADARIELEVPDEPNPPVSAAKRASWVWTIAGALLFAAAAFMAGREWTSRPAKPDNTFSRFLLDVRPADSLLGPNPLERKGYARMRPSRTALAISPDGRKLAFTAVRNSVVKLYIRSLSETAATEISGTEGADGPFFSPDGSWIGFWSDGAIRKVAVAGGPPVKVCDSVGDSAGAVWTDDDRIVFATNTIKIVPSSGGIPTELTKIGSVGDDARHVLPQILPGGKWLLFTALPAVYDWDHTRIVAQSLQTGEQRVLLEGASDARFVPAGYLVFLRFGNLMAAPFDAERAILKGSEAGILEGVMQAIGSSAFALDTGAGQFSFSSTGTLVFINGTLHPDMEGGLQWVRRDGSVEKISAPVRPYFSPSLSPDGSSLVVGTMGLREQSLWRYSFADKTMTRLTRDGRVEQPIWTPDGAKITFGLALRGPYDLYSMPSDGTGRPELLMAGGTKAMRFAHAWTADGKSLVFSEAGDIKLFSPGSDPKIRPLVATRFNERHADLSPDGRWLAYVSNETGHSEVYVQSFPDPGEKHQVSTDGGEEPAWSRNGRELIYIKYLSEPRQDAVQFLESDVTIGEKFKNTAPRPLFEIDGYGGGQVSRAWDMTPAADRFLIIHEHYPPSTSAPHEIQVIQNWFSELSKRVPTN